MPVDVMKRPEVEYDDSGNGTVTVYWNTPEGPMFSIVIQDGCLIGVMSGSQQQPPWKFDLPKGLLRVDCSVMTQPVT